jgi:hypothetical protein
MDKTCRTYLTSQILALLPLANHIACDYPNLLQILSQQGREFTQDLSYLKDWIFSVDGDSCPDHMRSQNYFPHHMLANLQPLDVVAVAWPPGTLLWTRFGRGVLVCPQTVLIVCHSIQATYLLRVSSQQPQQLFVPGLDVPFLYMPLRTAT